MSDISVFSTNANLRSSKIKKLRKIINGASRKQGTQRDIQKATGGFDDYWAIWKGSTRYWYYVPNKAILILDVWDTYCYVVWVASSISGTIRTLFEKAFLHFPGIPFYLHVDTSKETRKRAHAIYKHYGFNDISTLGVPDKIKNAGSGILMCHFRGWSPFPPRLLLF